MVNVDGGITASFQFSSYKIDSMQLKMKQALGLLELNGMIKPSLWDFQIGIRQPIFFKTRKCYVGGVDAKLLLYPKEMTDEEKQQQEPLIKLRAGIAGVFNIQETDRFAPDIEEVLVRQQIPAILFPYLRASMTSFLATAGFGSVSIPLLNIQAMAKDLLKEVKIDVKD
jgi:hypothetical protein